MTSLAQSGRFLWLFVLCTGLIAAINCAAPDVTNSGDPTTDAYYEHLLLRCGLADPAVCPSGFADIFGGGVTQIQPSASDTNLELWLEADALGLSDGTPIASWTDQSAGGFHATQATGTEQPLY